MRSQPTKAMEREDEQEEKEEALKLEHEDNPDRGADEPGSARPEEGLSDGEKNGDAGPETKLSGKTARQAAITYKFYLQN